MQITHLLHTETTSLVYLSFASILSDIIKSEIALHLMMKFGLHFRLQMILNAIIRFLVFFLSVTVIQAHAALYSTLYITQSNLWFFVKSTLTAVFVSTVPTWIHFSDNHFTATDYDKKMPTYFTSIEHQNI